MHENNSWMLEVRIIIISDNKKTTDIIEITNEKL